MRAVLATLVCCLAVPVVPAAQEEESTRVETANAFRAAGDAGDYELARSFPSDAFSSMCPSTGGSEARGGFVDIKAADAAYATAWLSNDPESVMATLTEDAVVIPSGMPAIEGAAAIREFWWPPESSSTTVTEFTLVQRDHGRSAGLAYVRGSFSLGFQYDGKTYASDGEYLSLLRCLSDGTWRIARRMWSDGSRSVNDVE